MCRAIPDVNPRRRIREMPHLGKGYPSTTPNSDQIWQSIHFLRQCVGLEADKMIVMLIYKKCTQKSEILTVSKHKETSYILRAAKIGIFNSNEGFLPVRYGVFRVPRCL